VASSASAASVGCASAAVGSGAAVGSSVAPQAATPISKLATMANAKSFSIKRLILSSFFSEDSFSNSI
jgi:hypothetical protein